MKTKALSSKDLRCGSEAACLNSWGRQRGVQGSGKRGQVQDREVIGTMPEQKGHSTSEGISHYAAPAY